MARVDNSGSRSVSTPRPESKPAPKNEAAPAPKKEAAPKKPADNFVAERNTQAFGKDVRNNVKHFAKSAKAEATTNRDGSVTRSKTTKEGKTTRSQELTTSKGLLREAKLKFEKTSTHGNTQTKNTYNSQSDIFGRTTSTHQREQTVTKGDTATTTSKTTATDQWGTQKKTEGKSTKVTTGDNSKTTSAAVTTDGRGNRAETKETVTVEKNGNKTVTKTTKETTGTERTTASSAKFEKGTYSLGEQVDWKDNRFNKEKSYNKEIELRPGTADKGFSQTQKGDKLDYAQKGGNALAAAGAKVTLTQGEVPKEKMKEVNLSTDPNSFRGSRVGYSGKHEVTVGADGVNASYNREAKAGLYAETKTPDIKEGEAGYQLNAGAKVEAAASVDAKGKLDLNGLDASVNAKVGVTAEASVGGKAQTKSVKVAGVDVNASVEGTAKASVSATAEANGKVKVTRNPPTAVAEGSVGASAVAKVEGEVKASAGPFSVKASAYASAGAEAKASGVIGYEDGKIKIGGSAGAALGLGAGGAVNVEVDVKQIGEMAKNTAVKVADVNGDGKLGVDDAKAVANVVKQEAKAAVNHVKEEAKAVVNNAKKKVLGWLGW